MEHCIHCLEDTIAWVPSHVLQNTGFATLYGCSTTVCAMQIEGRAQRSVLCRLNQDNGCKILSDEDAELLAKLERHQRCSWKSNDAYNSDLIVDGIRTRIRDAITRLKAEAHAHPSSTTPEAESTTDDSEGIQHSLDVEKLRVQIDISNSLRGLLELQHRRQAYREAAAGNLRALNGIDADNYPTIPPRVGPSTLPRSIGIADPVDSGDEEEPSGSSDIAKAAGKKRPAPGGSGKAAAGGKRPKTK